MNSYSSLCPVTGPLFKPSAALDAFKNFQQLDKMMSNYFAFLISNEIISFFSFLSYCN